MSEDGKTRSRRERRCSAGDAVKLEVKEEESDNEERREQRRRATRALRMVRKEAVMAAESGRALEQGEAGS